METVTLRLGDLSFHLRSGVSVTSLEEKLVDAARSGAGVVTVPLSEEGEVDAVVTPAVPIAVERHDEAIEVTGSTESEPAVPWAEVDLPE